MKQIRNYVIILLVIINIQTIAQLVPVGMKKNYTIKNYILQNPIIKFVKAVTDTLDLPFIDDFSYSSIYPDNSKWTNNYVYVNSHFGVHPPSVGVATFDLMDAVGDIYDYASTSVFGSDTLTSQAFNLEYYILDNSATFSSDALFYFNSESGTYFPADSLFYWGGTSFVNAFNIPFTYSAGEDTIYYYNTEADYYFNVSDSLFYFDGTTGYEYIYPFFVEQYQASDSVYMSFFIQPKGLAWDGPESKDSLVLHFYSPSYNQWQSVWRSAGGFEVDSFLQVLVPITDTIFLQNGFRFRFMNYGSLNSMALTESSGNQDFWHLDYVKIDRERSGKDSVLRDVAIQYLPPPALNEFYSMPWPHFRANGPALMGDSLLITYYVNDTIGKLIDRNYKWTDVLGTYGTYIFDTLTDNAVPYQNIFNSTLKNRIYDSSSSNIAVFEIEVHITTDITDYKNNDTVKTNHNFYNYYAYDDGTAEMGVMLGVEGSSNGKLAVKFHNYKEDTIRAVKFYFDKTYLNAFDNKFFYLTIWEDNDGVPGDTLFSRNNYRVDITDERDEYTYYMLDSVFVLPVGDFYVGYTTITEDEPIILGFDCNNDASDKIFFRFSGDWLQSNLEGAIMIQPIFGAPFSTDIQPVRKQKQDLQIFPNPSSGIINIKGIEENNFPVFVRVYNKLGQEVYSTSLQNNSLNLELLNNDMYLVQIIDKNGSSWVKKVFIR